MKEHSESDFPVPHFPVVILVPVTLPCSFSGNYQLFPCSKNAFFHCLPSAVYFSDVFLLSRFQLSALTLAGDPTVLGWATFVLYLLAAGLSFRSAKAGRAQDPENEFARSWRVLGILLFLLGLNKQLDLQTPLIELGRTLAIAIGIYHHRRDIQLIFFIGLVAGLIASLVACLKPLTAFVSKHRLCAAGFGLVGAYAFIRAGSIDHVDQMLGFHLDKTRGLWVLEVGGLVLVSAAAVQDRRQ